MSTDQPDIDLASDLQSFFHHLVDEAVRNQHCAATEAAEYYLAGLLADFAKPERLE